MRMNRDRDRCWAQLFEWFVMKPTSPGCIQEGALAASSLLRICQMGDFRVTRGLGRKGLNRRRRTSRRHLVTNRYTMPVCLNWRPALFAQGHHLAGPKFKPNLKEIENV